MAKQVELIQALNEQRNLVQQIGRETDGLLKRVTDLEEALKNQPEATPELEEAVRGLSEAVKSVNDKVPDAEPEPAPNTDVPADPDNPDADGVGVTKS